MKTLRFLTVMSLALAMVFLMAFSASAELTEVPPDSGSLLIADNDTVPASQKRFGLYKILDLKAYRNEEGEIVAYNYSVPRAFENFFAERYALDKEASDFDMKVIAAIQEEPDMYEFAAEVLEAAQNLVAPYCGAAVQDGYRFYHLPLGYYVVSDITTSGDYARPLSAPFLITVVPDLTVEVAAEIPPVDKLIDGDGDLYSTEDRIRSNPSGMGEDITFLIQSRVPRMDGYKKYFFLLNDSLSKGLTYNKDMTITVGNKPLTEGTDYEVTLSEAEDGSTKLEILFKNFLQYNIPTYIHQPITVSYTAQLNEKAEFYKIPNITEVYLSYSNNPTIPYQGEDRPTEEDLIKEPLGKTPSARTHTYTTAIEIVSCDPIGKRLSGAEFSLEGRDLNTVRVVRDQYSLDPEGEYWKLKNGSYTTTSPDSIVNGMPVDMTLFDSLTDKYRKDSIIRIVTVEEGGTISGLTGEDGVLRFEGLGVGDFLFHQLRSPDGYAILSELVDVSITWDAYDEDGVAFEYQGAADYNGTARVSVIQRPIGEIQPPQPSLDANLKVNHTLNLSGDISLNYIVPTELLEGYDIDDTYMEVSIPEYKGNQYQGSKTVTLLPEKRDSYYYFTLTDLTAVQMNDQLAAVLYSSKNGKPVVSYADSYSIATYALAQLDKEDAPVALKTLCADLLCYGAQAQLFKGYRTNALADVAMTEHHKVYLTDLDTVVFGKNNSILNDMVEPQITWVGKSLSLESKVVLRFVIETASYTGAVEDLTLRVSYKDHAGQEQTVTLSKPTAYGSSGTRYAFSFDGLLAAELRSVLDVAVFKGETQLSSTLRYSADTYGNGKTGTLLTLCKALVAYSDSAKAYFIG